MSVTDFSCLAGKGLHPRSAGRCSVNDLFDLG